MAGKARHASLCFCRHDGLILNPSQDRTMLPQARSFGRFGGGMRHEPSASRQSAAVDTKSSLLWGSSRIANVHKLLHRRELLVSTIGPKISPSSWVPISRSLSSPASNAARCSGIALEPVVSSTRPLSVLFRSLMPRGVKKEHLPSKVCVICQRPSAWRKKWDEVLGRSNYMQQILQ